MCSRLLCPYLVCFLSSSDVIISLFLSSRVCLIVYDYPLYISPVFWVWFRLVYLWLPGVSCLSALSCPALMSWLKTIIWVYVLVCVFLFLPRVCTVTEDQTKYSKRRPFTSFCFLFFEKFLFCSSVLCLSRGMEVTARYSRHSPLQVGVGGRRDRRECRESSGREPSCPPIAGDIRAAGGGSPKPAGGFPSSRVAAPPGAPFAGDHATRSLLTQCPPLTLCPPVRRWLKPARSPLTQARRIAADSCPPAAAIPSPVDQVHMSRPGVPCVCLVVPTGTF